MDLQGAKEQDTDVRTPLALHRASWTLRIAPLNTVINIVPWSRFRGTISYCEILILLHPLFQAKFPAAVQTKSFSSPSSAYGLAFPWWWWRLMDYDSPVSAISGPSSGNQFQTAVGGEGSLCHGVHLHNLICYRVRQSLQQSLQQSLHWPRPP